jgi:hypothetical protein
VPAAPEPDAPHAHRDRSDREFGRGLLQSICNKNPGFIRSVRRGGPIDLILHWRVGRTPCLMLLAILVIIPSTKCGAQSTDLNVRRFTASDRLL